MKLRGRNLHSSADDQGEAIAGIVLQLALAQHQCRSDEVLYPAVVRSAMVEGGVVFDLRPKEFADMIFPTAFHDWTSELRGIASRQYSSQRRLHIEASETLPAHGAGETEQGETVAARLPFLSLPVGSVQAK